MPFKSDAQRRFMYSQHPQIAKRWSKEAKVTGEEGEDLPEKITDSEPEETLKKSRKAKAKKKRNAKEMEKKAFCLGLRDGMQKAAACSSKRKMKRKLRKLR